MSISVNGVSKIYGTQTAVNNISFKVNKGEIVGFLGPNGAGKSTTMKMITGYLNPTSGTVAVCDIPVDKNKNASKQKVGYLPEANPLYFDMYVKEYLHFAAGIHQLNNVNATVAEAIETVGLQKEAHKKIGELSKGYKQRVGLAAALLHNPEVLILDEPTSGLDPNQIIEIRNVIKKLGETKTILFSSHILQEVEALCDRVIIINKGTVVADDQLKNLLATSKSQNEIVLEIDANVDIAIFGSDKNITKTAAGQYVFQTNDADALKRELMATALAQNIDIKSINSQQRNSLESLFKQLTN
jgi:ABC-2 type transport system ATP-binding protein